MPRDAAIIIPESSRRVGPTPSPTRGVPSSCASESLPTTSTRASAALDRRYRIDRVIAVLGRESPDIALLQEVAEDMPRSEFHDQAELPQRRAQYASRRVRPPAPLQHRRLRQRHFEPLAHRPRPTRRSDDWSPQAAGGDLRSYPRPRRQDTRERSSSSTSTSGSRTPSAAFSSSAFSRRIRSLTFITARRSSSGGDLNDVWGSLGPRFLLPAGFRACRRAQEHLSGTLADSARWTACSCAAIWCGRSVSAPRDSLTRQASDHLPLVAELDLLMDTDRLGRRRWRRRPGLDARTAEDERSGR